MKPIRPLCGPTPGLADYLRCDGDRADWEGFRSHARGQAYRELADALAAIQHGLCGYCEIDLIPYDRQVEHVIPRSHPTQGALLALDSANLLACCKGGTLNVPAGDRRRDPVRTNRSCGESKGDTVDENLVDPRDIPPEAPLMRVRFDGLIEEDEKACAELGVPANSVQRTIGILGLNVPRLRLARERRWRALNDTWKDHLGDAHVMMGAASAELLPGDSDTLPRFFTTNRCWFGPLGIERMLERHRDMWV